MNTGAFDAGIFISSLVWGFLPFLAALFLTSNDPNPTNWILSPPFNASETTSTNAFNVYSVTFFDSPVFADIAATNSALFIVNYLLYIFVIIICTYIAVFKQYLYFSVYLFSKIL